MSDVEFMEENNFHTRSQRVLGQQNGSPMINFLMKTGVVKTQKGAMSLLIMVSIISLASTVFLIRARTTPEVANIVDRFGNEYTTEEYIKELEAGRNPLDTNYVPRL
jgi:hypothetical protein